MSSHEEMYRTRAAEARADAEAATLANVRERCIRSALAWEGMAERARRTDRLRSETEARKAAENSPILTAH
jgi:hypothetical protein